jgi:inorganic pyrophosphatase
MDYWESIESIILKNGITIDRKKGSHHPKYNDFIYHVDYGYINNSKSMDQNEIDIFVGSMDNKKIEGLFCTIDLLKLDSEIKVIYECSSEEIDLMKEDLNNSKYMKAILVYNKENSRN